MCTDVSVPVVIPEYIPVSPLVSSNVRHYPEGMKWMSFADWLKRERTAAKLSQGRLAEATGISRPYITRMEKPGGVGLPTPAIREKLHAVFGTSDDQLVEEGVAVRREYPQADGSVSVEYEVAPAPSLIPPAQSPDQRSGGDGEFYKALGEYLPTLGPAQRAHLIETARLMAGAVATRESTPEASSSSDPAETRTAPDRSNEE